MARSGTAVRVSPFETTGGYDEHAEEDAAEQSEARGLGESEEAPIRALAGPLSVTRWRDAHGAD